MRTALQFENKKRQALGLGSRNAGSGKERAKERKKMARNESEFLKSFGKAFEVFKSLTDEVLAQGGSDEDVSRILTDRKIRQEMVGILLKKAKQAVDSVARLFVDYTQPLRHLIDDNHFDYVNSDITEKHFPINKRSNDKVEMKVFSTEELVGKTKTVTSEEVERALDQKGYRTAELPEALAYAKANPDEQRKYPIVILGSVWRLWYGDRGVPYLWGHSGGRSLGLDWCGLRWVSVYRFLAVRKS